MMGAIMKKLAIGVVAVAATANSVFAGGLDRSGQSVAAIFEDGTHAEISFGLISPSLTGVEIGAFGGEGSGQIAPTYYQLGLAYKQPISDRLSAAVIVDNPFGAAVEYTEPTYLLNGTSAHVNTTGITGLLNADIGNGLSVHGGARLISASGDYTNPLIGFLSDYSQGTGFGYAFGAAYEVPDIALRVALTWSSEVDIELSGSAVGSTLTATLPQSVNLDFQTGIAADTLLFGKVRWAEWTTTVLTDLACLGCDGGSGSGIIQDYDNDVVTYSIGIGRRFSDTLSGAITLGYEEPTDGTAGDLSPSDGYRSIGIGLTKRINEKTEISGGANYVILGDATTTGIGSTFADNSVFGIGIKIETKF
jgi:long-subunit fatty acid transport protein